MANNMPAPPRRIAFTSTLADTSPVANLLRSHGFSTKLVATSAADILLPGLGGGSLAFLLASGECGSTSAAMLSSVAEQALQASKAARRCCILWIRPSEGIIDALQSLLAAGVNVVSFESHEEAAEFILACSQRVLLRSGGASADDTLEAAQRTASDEVAAHLARLWGIEQHHVDFLFAARPLSSLAHVSSEEAWQQLLQETEGLLDPRLLHMAIEWLQRDAPRLW